MPRRLSTGWVAAIGLLLVLGGLILMHVADRGEHEVTGTNTYGMREAGEPDCDGCRHGSHLPAACMASLGAVAVWRVADRRRGDTPSAVSSRLQGHPHRPRALLRSGQPPWIALGVMRN